MLENIDAAWQLAEARSDHMREVRGDSLAGDEYVATIATIEGDGVRACRHLAKLVDGAPPGSEGVMASWRSMLARELCRLDRFDEAESQLREAETAGFDPVTRTLVSATEAVLLTRTATASFGQAEGLARTAVGIAETETDNVWLHGWSNEDLALVLERAGRIDEALDALERALVIWERKRCVPIARRLREQMDTLRRADRV